MKLLMYTVVLCFENMQKSKKTLKFTILSPRNKQC